MQPLHNLVQQARQNWLVLLLLFVCLVPWVTTRITFLYQYQTPPNQTVHPNYYTFHEMSQSWMEGKKLGVINVNRMLLNGQRLMLVDYLRHETPDDKHCTYLSLDPGYALIVTAARKLFTPLPDSYLRATAMQVVCDGLLLFAIFITFLRIGILPATVAGLIYALHPVFSYQAIFPFQYFWEGWIFGASVIALIWARRCSLANKQVPAILLVILIAVMAAFALWVRSSALVAALSIISVFMFVPSLRRYWGIFCIVMRLATERITKPGSWRQISK